MLQAAVREGFQGSSCYTVLDVATARGSVPNVALYGVAQWKGQPDMLPSVLVFVHKRSETWSFYQFHFFWTWTKTQRKAAFPLAHTGEDAGEGVAARAGDWPDALPLQSGSKEETRSGAKLLKGPDLHSAPPPRQS